MKVNLTYDVVSELVSYDSLTGVMTWKRRDEKWFLSGRQEPSISMSSWNSKHAGNEAFTTIDPCGYRYASLLGRKVKGHRVAWLLFYKEWPVGFIDHLNGVRDDNRIENLRSVSRLENQKNMKRNCRNKSGFTGVTWDRRLNKWKSQVRSNGKQLHLGVYDNIEEAIKARIEANKHYGFHDNHGHVKNTKVDNKGRYVG